MRCPPEILDDLAEVLAEVRTWADVRGRAGWVQLELPRPISVTRRRAFLRELRRRYRAVVKRDRSSW